jgi:hypothetical protein
MTQVRTHLTKRSSKVSRVTLHFTFSLTFVLPTWQKRLLIVFTAKLLRVRKDLPTTLPVAIAQAKWEKLVSPLFSPSQVVEQSLVDLRYGNIIATLNQELREYEAGAGSRASRPSRPINRQGTYLADDDYGLLVTDMTTFGGKFCAHSIDLH